TTEYTVKVVSNEQSVGDDGTIQTSKVETEGAKFTVTDTDTTYKLEQSQDGKTITITNNADSSDTVSLTDTDTTYTSTVTSEGLSGNQVSKLTITNDATGDKTEFFDTDTQYEGRVEFVEDGKDFGEGEVKYGIYSTTQTAKADSKQTEEQSTGGTVGNDADAGTAATPAAGADNTTSSTGDNSSTVTAEASGGEEITISGKELILKAGDNVKISNEEGKALITAKDTTLEKSSDALSLDGKTLTLTVRDTDGNEVTGEADLSSLAGASDFEGDDAKAVTPADGKLTIKGGADANSLTDNNIGVVADGDNGLRVKLAKNITDVDSIQVNNSVTASTVNATNVNAATVNATDVKASTVTADSFYAGDNIFNSSGLSVGGGNVTVTNKGFVVQGGPSMTSSGINAGGKKIT
ncbi:MAG: hypothetical protein KIG68_01375, partial [Oxalobacter sp.]|nr:hypothetical protein [Oxalobacter sp.]